jgi:hypothetical protein
MSGVTANSMAFEVQWIRNLSLPSATIDKLLEEVISFSWCDRKAKQPVATPEQDLMDLEDEIEVVSEEVVAEVVPDADLMEDASDVSDALDVVDDVSNKQTDDHEEGDEFPITEADLKNLKFDEIDSDDDESDKSEEVEEKVIPVIPVPKKTRKRTLRPSYELCFCKKGSTEERCSRPSHVAIGDKDISIEVIQALVSADPDNLDLKCKIHQKSNNGIYQAGVDEILETSVPTNAKSSKKSEEVQKAPPKSRKKKTTEVSDNDVPILPLSDDELRSMAGQICNISIDMSYEDWPKIDYTTRYYDEDRGIGICHPTGPMTKDNLCILSKVNNNEVNNNGYKIYNLSEYLSTNPYIESFIATALRFITKI